MRRFARAVALLTLICSAGGSQQFAPVASAITENVQPVQDRKAIRFEIRNLGPKSITAFEFVVTENGSGGGPAFCTGRGQDMLDWSDPMPGTGMVVNMRRSWIEPNGTLRTEGYLVQRCLELLDSPQYAVVELRAISFEDGTGEGNPNLLNFFYRTRKAILDERVKWLPRFVSLRSASNLRDAAKQLYQDLTDAKYHAESDLAGVKTNGMGAASLQKMQQAAKRIESYGETHSVLEPGSLAAWLISDLEQRTERMVRGIGTAPDAVQ